MSCAVARVVARKAKSVARVRLRLLAEGFAAADWNRMGPWYPPDLRGAGRVALRAWPETIRDAAQALLWKEAP